MVGGAQAPPFSTHPDPARRVQLCGARPRPEITPQPPGGNTVVGEAEPAGSGKWSVCHVPRCGCGRLPSFVIIIKYNFGRGRGGGSCRPLTAHRAHAQGRRRVNPSHRGRGGESRCLLTHTHTLVRRGQDGHCPALSGRAPVSPSPGTCAASSLGSGGPVAAPPDQLQGRQNHRTHPEASTSP